MEEEWRGTHCKMLEVQCEVSTVCVDLGSHVICWCWSTVCNRCSVRLLLPIVGAFSAVMHSMLERIGRSCDDVFARRRVRSSLERGSVPQFKVVI